MTQSELLKSIRKYFWKRNFTEIEVPYLNSSLPLEPNIYSFKTNWEHKKQAFYLPTSPEMALKNHLANNRQNCFAISHCFRDLEAENKLHSPEFIMLEWYLPDKNLTDLIKFTKNFVHHFLKIDFVEFKLPKNLPQNEADFNQYFLNEIEPNLPTKKGVFVTGYPDFLSPLAKTKEISDANNFSDQSEREPALAGEPEGSEDRKNLFASPISDRFELYINGIEIANGCVENTDSQSIKSSFEAEKKYRLTHKLPLHPVSTSFIDSCSHLSLCSGVGLGLNRFLNLLK